MSSGPGTRPTCGWDEYRPAPDGRGDDVYWHCEEEAITSVKTRTGELPVCGEHYALAHEMGLADAEGP